MTISLLGVAALALFQGDSTESAHFFFGTGQLLTYESPDEIAFDLSPAAGPIHKQEKARSHAVIDDEEFVELVTRLVKSSGVGDDFKLVLKGHDLGIIGGPKIQHEAGRALDALQTGLINDERLEIRVLSLGPGADIDSDAILIDQVEADRREAAITDSKRGRIARTGRARAIDGMVASIDEVDTRRFIRGYTAELGVASLPIDPLNDTEVEGLKATFRAARVTGATLVDLALRYSEPAAPTRELSIEPTLWYVEPRRAASDDSGVAVGARMFHGRKPLPLQLPIHRFVSLVGNFVIPDGQALWMPVRVATKGAPSSLVVEARVRGPHRPLFEQLSQPSDSRQLTLIRLAAVQSTSFDAPIYEPSSFEELTPVDQPQTDPGDPWARHSPAAVNGRAGNSELLGLASEFAQLEIGGVRAEATWIQKQYVVVDSPEPIDEALSKRFGECVRPPRSVELQGRVMRGGETAAEFRLPVVLGRNATIWSGNQGATLRRWDVGVANIQQVGLPVLVWYLDGLALTFFASSIDQGRLQLTARGVVSLVEQPPTLAELGNPDTPVYETMRSRRLFVDGAATVAIGGKPASFTIGGSSLALEVTVVAR